MKILLNCLPPADIYSPSISLSILSRFMRDNGVETSVKYWNFKLSLMADYTDSEDTEKRLLPFLSMLNDRHGNEKGNQRILSLLQSIHPNYKSTDPHYYHDFLDETKAKITDVMQQELDLIDWNEIGLFGITAKFNQWLPGMLLASEVKKRAPHVKIIVGGFGSDDVAREAMNLCADFDFVTWGEGEYPLLELSKQIQTNPDYSQVPRLIYREDDHLVQSASQQSEYLDFDIYIYPDFTDYLNTFPEHEDRDQISIPINSIRSCHWHRCNFCDFNKGYKLRARTPECVVDEIAAINKQYQLTTFTFVDSDTFGSLKHFERLLDLLIDLKYRTEEDFSFWAEIIPNAHYSHRLMEKMAIAGFKNLFIGYDGLSDGLLKKMNKSNTFSDNVLFIKYSLKHGIYPFVNVIKHVPGETEEDVQECIDNLHYLRFFYNDKVVDFSHNYVTLVLSSMSKYYKLMPETELAHYNTDELSYLLPDSFPNGDKRFHLFRYQRDVAANTREWDKLIQVEDYYKNNRFSYRVQQHGGIFYYTEYCNDTEIENVVFGEPEYAFVLKTAGQQVITFDALLEAGKREFPTLTKQRLTDVIANLKASYLLYCNSEYSNVISLIDVE
ncbi:radical SAM protein [Carboxylicivirga sp. M1479]|uniref:B12-binding domain-containing radical SAM protein n=1 Tax=Carboxylicivirga sp. M1479 TaxID=2594476 RepID=UPI00163DE3F0|nr:radical SAM protein [Carboxylicivirga sp. M1479]